jgi:glycosylphosphatidylinositol transamidase
MMSDESSSTPRTLITATTNADELPVPDPKQKEEKSRQRWRKLLFLPYFIGIVWTCLHPSFSVLTGETKCRGWFIDEHALSIPSSISKNFKAPPPPAAPQGFVGLCDNFNTSTYSNLSCHRHGDHFHVASLVPISSAVEPNEEAIVLVVPAPKTGEWTTSHFHYSLLHLFRHLANPIETPWMAKTILLVSPSPSSLDQSLETTVTSFLDAYLGSKQSTTSVITPLPARLSGAMLRNLLVLDVEAIENGALNYRSANDKQKPYTEMLVLPQGRRGVVPNMDLVFAAGQILSKATSMNQKRYPQSQFLAHPYTEQYKEIQEYLDKMPTYSKPNTAGKTLESKFKDWAQDMANLGLFAYTLAMGPYPPHAPALDRGIDSLTIQARFYGTYYMLDPVVEFVQMLEYFVKGLSNLHERLHHSATLYLLPTPKKFVSHVEYLLPNLLILLPLAVRAILLLYKDMERIHLKAVGWAIMAALIAMGTMLVSYSFAGEDLKMTHAWLVAPYALVVAFFWGAQLQQFPKSDTLRVLQSMQFVACLTAVYIHVPIAFAHVSLAYPSALLWTPLLAFPNYGGSPVETKSLPRRICLLAVLLCTAPPLLVPRVFASYTTFMRFAYVPLHVQLFALVLTRLLY